MNPEALAQLRAQVLETLRHFRGRSLHAGELRGRLGLDKSQHPLLVSILDAMAETGELQQMPGGRYRLSRRKRVSTPEVAPASVPSSKDQVDAKRKFKNLDMRSGSLVINARGFGFVATMEPGPDVFIPPIGLAQAMHGDRVRVSVRAGNKGLEGRILSIEKRGTEYVSGQLHLSGNGAFIDCDDERVRYPILVRKPLPKRATTGQGVIAKIDHYPEHPGDRIEATIVESFEPKQFVEFETRRILFREGAIETFSEEASAEAKALPKAVPERDKRDRVDLRDLDLVTIDPEDAKDHDDAVWAERIAGGRFRVIVAIADVSHYVTAGSALDLEAQARGCTIYLPAKAIPMLPAELSSNLASLVPNRDRLALAVEATVGPRGAVERYQFLEAVVRSHARLTYAGVAKALELTTEGPIEKNAQSRLPLLRTLMDVAEVLGGQRRRRGSLAFDLPEAKVQIENSTGRPLDVLRSRSDPGIRKTYNMIEELALLANEVVAAELSKRKLPTIYRVHAPPDADRIIAFSALATSLGYKFEAEDAQNPKKLAKFLLKIQKSDKAETLGYLLLRAMQQAVYDIHNVGHFGLAAKAYVHFTSPIRRYPDLVMHRVVRDLARNQRVRTKGLREELAQHAEASSRLERRAMAIEREVVDLYRAMIMQDRIGDEFEGAVTGITEHGVFVSIDSPFVDVLCRTAALPHDRWQMDTYGISLSGLLSGHTFSLGQRLRVRIEDVSLARRRVSAVPVDLVSSDSSSDEPDSLGAEKSRSRRRMKGPKPEQVRRERKVQRRQMRKEGHGGKSRAKKKSRKRDR